MLNIKIIPKPKPKLKIQITVVSSDSNLDKPYIDELEKNFNRLKSEYSEVLVSYLNPDAGMNRQHYISRIVSKTDIFIFPLSIDFLNSKKFKLVKSLIKKNDNQKYFLHLYLRSCDYNNSKFLKTNQDFILPSSNKPIAHYGELKDDAFTDIKKHLNKKIGELQFNHWLEDSEIDRHNAEVVENHIFLTKALIIIVSVILILLSIMSSFFQEKNQSYSQSMNQIPQSQVCNEKLKTCKCENGLRGYRKCDKVKIGCKFERVSDFNEGLAAVKYEGNWGVINEKGEIVVPMTSEYLMIGKYSNGLAGVWDFERNFLGYIDNKGDLKIELSKMCGGNCRNGRYFTGNSATIFDKDNKRFKITINNKQEIIKAIYLD